MAATRQAGLTWSGPGAGRGRPWLEFPGCTIAMKQPSAKPRSWRQGLGIGLGVAGVLAVAGAAHGETPGVIALYAGGGGMVVGVVIWWKSGGPEEDDATRAHRSALRKLEHALDVAGLLLRALFRRW